ncbi:hypothetical protein BSTEL_2208, partial [Bifidobacterium stellenboschense]
ARRAPGRYDAGFGSAARAASASWCARRSTCALKRMICCESARLTAWMKSPTCSICTHRFARSMMSPSRRLPIMRPYAVSTALRCASSSLEKIHARSRAGSFTCMRCQLLIAVIVEPLKRTSPSSKPPCTMHVLNAHRPSVSMIFDQLEVISGGTWPAFFNRAIHEVSCARICPVTYAG